MNGQRIAYGNVTPADDVASLFGSDFLAGGEHERRLGPIQEIPYLIKQDRWTFFRVGLIEPLVRRKLYGTPGFQGPAKSISKSAARQCSKP